MDLTEAIRSYYDASVEAEWGRIENRPEFILTCRYLDRYIKPGERVLDIGGGPGRYALHLAKRGCCVMLLDLSPENIRFAKERAAERGLSLHAVAGDARCADTRIPGLYDHVLLMGPLYHLLGEADRVQAVDAALRLLKPGGVLFASFISAFAGMIYMMKHMPQAITDEGERAYLDSVRSGRSYAGPAFTHAFFIDQREVLPFMARFGLEKLHLFGQEGITAPCEGNILSQSADVVGAWLDMAEQLSEREELLCLSEHLMYVGRKRHA